MITIYNYSFILDFPVLFLVLLLRFLLHQQILPSYKLLTNSTKIANRISSWLNSYYTYTSIEIREWYYFQYRNDEWKFFFSDEQSNINTYTERNRALNGFCVDCVCLHTRLYTLLIGANTIWMRLLFDCDIRCKIVFPCVAISGHYKNIVCLFNLKCVFVFSNKRAEI